MKKIIQRNINLENKNQINKRSSKINIYKKVFKQIILNTFLYWNHFKPYLVFLIFSVSFSSRRGWIYYKNSLKDLTKLKRNINTIEIHLR